MKKTILLVLALVLILSIAALPALSIVRITLINKTGYPLQVRIEEVGEPLNYWFYNIPEGDRDYPETVVLDLPPVGDEYLWYVTAWGITDEKVAGTAYNTSFSCFGEADRVLYDDYSATRIFFLKGVGDNKNKIVFTERSCEVPVPKWFTLKGKNYYFPKGDNNWVY